MDASSLILSLLAAIAGFVVGGGAALGLTRRTQARTQAQFETQLLAEVEGLRKNHRQHTQQLIEAQETLEARLAESEQERAELQDRMAHLSDELGKARVALTDLLQPRQAPRPARALSGRP